MFKLAAVNRGFLYGDGFFESFRVLQGHIPLLPYHLQRIEEAVEIYQFDQKEPITEESLLEMIDTEKHPDHLIRISFYREGEGKYGPMNNHFATAMRIERCQTEFWLPHKLDLMEELDSAPQIKAQMLIYPKPKPIADIFTVKSLSSAYYVLAAKFLNEQQAHFLLLKDAEGYLLEEVTSNILYVKDGALYQIPKNSGQVTGACLRFLNYNYGFQINERKLHESEIHQVEAIYLCNGSRGLRKLI